MENEFCIRCGHEPSEGDEYCIQCGAPLKNRCTYDGGPFSDPCTKVNDRSAAFCAKCGRPTVFNKAGLLNTGYRETMGHRSEDPDEWQHFSHRFFAD